MVCLPRAVTAVSPPPLLALLRRVHELLRRRSARRPALPWLLRQRQRAQLLGGLRRGRGRLVVEAGAHVRGFRRKRERRAHLRRGHPGVVPHAQLHLLRLHLAEQDVALAPLSPLQPLQDGARVVQVEAQLLHAVVGGAVILPPAPGLRPDGASRG